jgi:multicomponent Na+:H+ antiporter subunit E
MRIRFSKRLVFWAMTLFALWLLLSESFNPAHLLIGLVAATCVAALHEASHSRRPYSVHWWSALAYFPWLFGEIFASGVRLSYLILHPRMPIRPRIFRYQTSLGNDLATTLLGNSITLTPGTVTVEARTDELVIHTIDGEETRAPAIRRLEKRVSKVFQTGGEQQ